MVLGQQVEFIILHHLSHPTLVVGLKDDESDGGYHLKAKVGRNLAISSISVTFTCFRSLTAVRMTQVEYDDELYLLA